MPTVPGNQGIPASPLGEAPSQGNLLMAQALMQKQAQEQQFTSQKAGNRPSFPAMSSRKKLKVVK
jgi:hypothetical protein